MISFILNIILKHTQNIHEIPWIISPVNDKS